MPESKMKIQFIAVCAALFLSSIGAAQGEDSNRYVLVAAEAKYYTAPDNDAPFLLLADGKRAGKGPPWQVLPNSFRLVADHDNWVEVETFSENPDRHCQDPPFSLRDFRIRLFVRKQALFRTTVKPLIHEYKKGLKVFVPAGYPLDPAAKGDKLLGFADRYKLPVSKADAGDSYSPTHEPPTRSEPYIYCPSEQSLMPLGVASSCRSTDRVLRTRADPEKQGWLIATLDEGCVEREVRAYRSTVAVIGVITSDGSGDALAAAFEEGGLGIGPSETGHTVNKGAKAYWRSGKEAGELAANHTFDAEMKDDGKRKCFATVTACTIDGSIAMFDPACNIPAKKPHIELCFDPKEVIAD